MILSVLAMVITLIIQGLCYWVSNIIIQRLVVAIREFNYESTNLYLGYLLAVTILMLSSVHFALTSNYMAVLTIGGLLLFVVGVVVIAHWMQGGD